MPLALYICAAAAWILLLRPYPVAVFMAACASCVLYPLYRWLQKRLPGTPGLLIYIGIVCACIVLPVLVLVLLVMPQATAGFNMLQRLRESNFQIPDQWMEYWLQIKQTLSLIPGFESMLNDITQNFDSLMTKSVGAAVSGGVGLVGSTLSALWIVFLFCTLTVLCSTYAARLHTVTASLTRLPGPMLDRFIHAIRAALRGVLLGVVLVALTQGILCGIGFAVAGIKQPAFWGMLATLVAPIPIVGTALVWLPLCLMLWFTGATWQAVGLCLWGIIAVAGVDNFLRPLFLQQGIEAPIFVLVLAILCGLATFGAVGLVVGPVLLAFSIQALKEADLLQTPSDVE